MPYSTLRYNSDRDYWNEWFPADWVSESFPGQFRNWFYSLLAQSTAMTGRKPFKNLFSYAPAAGRRRPRNAQVVGQRHLV